MPLVSASGRAVGFDCILPNGVGTTSNSHAPMANRAQCFSVQPSRCIQGEQRAVESSPSLDLLSRLITIYM
eukprot:2827654-Pyramimonas_sp.AAC.1